MTAYCRMHWAGFSIGSNRFAHSINISDILQRVEPSPNFQFLFSNFNALNGYRQGNPWQVEHHGTYYWTHNFLEEFEQRVYLGDVLCAPAKAGAHS